MTVINAQITLDVPPGPQGPQGPQGLPGSGGLPYVADLAAFMTSHYGVGWTQRSGVGLGTDIGPALMDACAFLRANYGRGIISITPGSWLMSTALTPEELSGHTIVGVGSQGSKVIWNSDGGIPFHWSGANGYTGGGMRGVGILLEDGHPNSTAYGILAQGDAIYQPDQMMFEDIYLTALGNSYWFNGFQIYGNARTSPQGVRIGDITNLQIFRCRNAGFYGSNMVGWSGRNIGCYVGQGGGNTFYVAGGGTPSTNSTNCDFDLVSATLNVANVSNVKINGTSY